MSAKRPKDHVPGICCRCNHPTERHPRADYCWGCQSKVNRENDLCTAVKQKAKRDEKRRLKQEELKKIGVVKRKDYFPPIRKEFSFQW